jgi:ligand-binding sensor domain-containing protein
MLLAWCPLALALNPALDISQYAHNAWRIRDGFTKGVINAIAQTSDGYLWLGTEFGLLRFDGVNGNLWTSVPHGFWRWKPGSPRFYPTPDDPNSARAFGEDDDGALLISSRRGIRRLDGERTELYSLPGVTHEFKSESLFRDRDGSLWVGTDGGGALARAPGNDRYVRAGRRPLGRSCGQAIRGS